MEEEATNLDLEDMNLLLRNMPPKIDAEQVRLQCSELDAVFQAPEEVQVVTIVVGLFVCTTKLLTVMFCLL